jgi:hypothetical protein
VSPYEKAAIEIIYTSSNASFIAISRERSQAGGAIPFLVLWNLKKEMKSD